MNGEPLESIGPYINPLQFEVVKHFEDSKIESFTNSEICISVPK